MVDPARIDELLRVLDEELEELHAAARQDRDELLADATRLRAVKYGFVVAIATAIDIAEHIIASQRLRTPTSFADAFDVLQEAEWLDEDLVGRMRSAAGFRNRLVHGYADVDDEIVADTLQTGPDDLQVYRREIAMRLVERDDQRAPPR